MKHDCIMIAFSATLPHSHDSRLTRPTASPPRCPVCVVWCAAISAAQLTSRASQSLSVSLGRRVLVLRCWGRRVVRSLPGASPLPETRQTPYCVLSLLLLHLVPTSLTALVRLRKGRSERLNTVPLPEQRLDEWELAHCLQLRQRPRGAYIMLGKHELPERLASEGTCLSGYVML